MIHPAQRRSAAQAATASGRWGCMRTIVRKGYAIIYYIPRDADPAIPSVTAEGRTLSLPAAPQFNVFRSWYKGRPVDFTAQIAKRWLREPLPGVGSATMPYSRHPTQIFPDYADHSFSSRKYALMNEYEGCTLDEIFCGSECPTSFGDCYAIHSVVPAHITRPDADDLSRVLMQELRLIHGIGPKKTAELRRRGYTTVDSLTRHPRFGRQATDLAALLAAEDWGTLARYAAIRFPASHPLNLLFSLLCRTNDLFFFDIETMGLFSRPIVLFATGRIRGGQMHITQYLLRDIGEEPAAIAMVLDEMADQSTALVTYNGRSFDLPYLRDRAAYYGMEFPGEPHHYDLLHPSRSRWKTEFPDCRLSTIEELALGIWRDDDLPGKYVPEYYAAYLRSRNPGPLVPIVDHNRQDVASLARLYEHLLEGFGRCLPSEM